MSEPNDCEEQGFSRIEDGCHACAPTFVDGKPVYPRIEPRGEWLRCVKCGGSYGRVPNGVHSGDAASVKMGDSGEQEPRA